MSAADRARLPRSGAALEALVRPELVKLLPAGGAGSTAATGAMATVIAREYYGHDQILRVRLDDGLELEARLGPTERLRPGERVGVRVTDAVRFFAADADS